MYILCRFNPAVLPFPIPLRDPTILTTLKGNGKKWCVQTVDCCLVLPILISFLFKCVDALFAGQKELKSGFCRGRCAVNQG